MAWLLEGKGPFAQIVEEYKLDDGLLAAMERAEHGAAEELGHLPKADVNVQNNVILIREREPEAGRYLEPLG